MGTFLGHAVPGSFFIIFAFWWASNAYIQYTKAKRTSSRYRSSLFFTINRYSRLPLESFVKVFFTLFGVTGEAVTGFDATGIFTRIGNGQHITMFSFFCLHSVVEILVFYNFRLPPNIEYVSGAMAFFIEGLLFVYHLHGKTPLEVHVHVLLIYAIFACGICVILEGINRRNVLFPLLRSYFVLIQGTWFYQVGFILYPPFPGMEHWEDHNHRQLMMVTMIFTWHCAVNFIILLGVGLLITKHILRLSPANLSMNTMLPIKKTMKEQALLIQSDSESEVM